MKFNLFQTGDFKLHSGGKSNFKIECDVLTDADWDTLARIISSRIVFKKVVGVPRGGLKLEQALKKYETNNSDVVLIVDDVLTTGASILTEMKKYEKARGFIVFARSKPPKDVYSIFEMKT